MLVKDRMTKHPITISQETPVAEALTFMRQNRIRRLPVLDRHGRLVGIVSEKDLLYVSPSPATTLSVYEVGYLLSKIRVEEIMTRKVITVSPDTPLEQAARIMVDNKIGGLPVMEDGVLVGIITETDIFKTLLEMLGAREHGIRVTMETVDEPGKLSAITAAIAQINGDIVALGAFRGDSPEKAQVMLKVQGVEQEKLLKALEAVDVEIVDIREC